MTNSLSSWSLAGKVAFVTGAARGQGRSHALTLAAQGADIIAADICHDTPGVPYPLATPDDLAETARGVEALDRRIVAVQADTRDINSLQSAFDRGVAQLGGCDIVVANAGVTGLDSPEPDPYSRWQTVIDTNLTGTWHTLRVSTPTMIDQGRGGSVIITGSTSALRGNNPGTGAGEAYTASKHTGMIRNDSFDRVLQANPEIYNGMNNLLPVDVLQPEDISNAVLFLASDAAKYITGISLPVDAGYSSER